MWNSISDFDRMFMTPNVLHRRIAPMLNNYGETGESRTNGHDVAVNLYDDETSFRLIALVPGVSKENVEIQINGRNLFLKATSSSNVPEKYTARNKQRMQVMTNRNFRLPTDVETDNVEATLEDGVLTLIIPKAEKTQPITIAIH